ncbi:Sphingolipid delta(4)-desaturase [Lachnellula subtilissima]|uniref:Sphingolipid delta(4)-desaturase n=1 Tax=Lachnellula subtilissima TaxID=602034 RepID=A0A8H8RC48_9HELO|nr:Sphingolipid delta(4)-desaturase [Lachnellula subtilissima]
MWGSGDGEEERRPYHLTHHKSLGVDGLDTDLPTSLEALFLDSILGKAFFCTFQILFYAVRPIFIYQVPFTSIHVFNIATQLSYNYLLVHFSSWNALWYLILSSFLAGSLHPCAGHFIAEHYLFDAPTASSTASSTSSSTKDGKPVQTDLPETFSYYGILNLFTYNVGLHNEHHDFPAVPWSRLWELHRVANEFYVDLPGHKSWVNVIWRFIGDKGVGMRCRVKRREGGRVVGGKGGAWKDAELEVFVMVCLLM